MEDQWKFSNFHLHGTDIGRIKNFVRLLGQEWKRANNKDINISIPKIACANHHYMLESEYLIRFCKYHQVEWVPAYGIRTKDGYHLNVINPQEGAKQLLEALVDEKIMWMTVILEELIKLGKPIHPEMMLRRTKKKLHEIEVPDLCTELILEHHNYEGCQDPTSAYENVIKPLILEYPIHKLSFDEVMYYTQDDEDVILCEFQEVKDLKQLLTINPCINGVVITKDTTSETLTYLKQNNINVLPGTGEWI